MTVMYEHLTDTDSLAAPVVALSISFGSGMDITLQAACYGLHIMQMNLK